MRKINFEISAKKSCETQVWVLSFHEMYENGTSTAKTMGLRFWPGSQIVEVFPELFKIQIDRHRPPLLNLSDKYNTFLKYKDNIYNVM